MTSFILSHVFQLLGIFLVLLINGVLVAAEMALIRLRFSHFNPDLLDYIDRHPRLERVMRDPDSVIQSFRLAITFCLLAMGLLLVAPARNLLAGSELAGWSGASLLAGAIAILVAGALNYLVTDLVPRGLGSAAPVGLLNWLFWPLMGLVWILRPLTRVLHKVGAMLLRFMQVPESRPLAPLEIEAQLEMMGDERWTVPLAVQKILRNTIQMRDLVVSDVLLPRNQVKIFDLQVSNAENLALARSTGHTRFPLCDGDLDRCLGLIHVKDLFRVRGLLEKVDFRRLKRDMIRVDAEEPLEGALTKLLAHNVHMALVIDEFRGVEGVLTLERVLEQLVGDIRDEFDVDEAEFIREADPAENGLTVDGLTPLHELEEFFRIDLSNAEVSTVSGLITMEIGRIPEVGEVVEVSALRFEVRQVDETRVLEAHVELVQSPAADDEA